MGEDPEERQGACLSSVIIICHQPLEPIRKSYYVPFTSPVVPQSPEFMGEDPEESQGACLLSVIIICHQPMEPIQKS